MRFAGSLFVVLLVALGCGGASPAPAAPGVPTATVSVSTDQDEPPATSSGVAGSWTGTITFHGVVDVDETDNGNSADDPTGAYSGTWTETTTTHLDATDTFTVTGNDPADMSYGIGGVDLTGSAANAGTTLERWVTEGDTSNSACTYKEEQGQEVSGSWSGQADAVGDISFAEDGSYSIQINTGPSDVPQVSKRSWLDDSDLQPIAAGDTCTANSNYDMTTPSPPMIDWVSRHEGDADVNGVYADIKGQLDVSNPGSVVDGSKTWQMNTPDGFSMTVTWHLEHTGPIALPHE